MYMLTHTNLKTQPREPFLQPDVVVAVDDQLARAHRHGLPAAHLFHVIFQRGNVAPTPTQNGHHLGPSCLLIRVHWQRTHRRPFHEKRQVRRRRRGRYRPMVPSNLHLGCHCGHVLDPQRRVIHVRRCGRPLRSVPRNRGVLLAPRCRPERCNQHPSKHWRCGRHYCFLLLLLVRNEWRLALLSAREVVNFFGDQ